MNIKNSYRNKTIYLNLKIYMQIVQKNENDVKKNKRRKRYLKLN